MHFFYISLIFLIPYTASQRYRTATVLDGGSLIFTYSAENNYFGNKVFRREAGCSINNSYNIVIDTERVLTGGKLQAVYFYAFPYTDSIRFYIFRLTGNSLDAPYQIWIKSASQNPIGSLYTVNLASDNFYVQSGDRMALGFESTNKCIPSTPKKGYMTYAIYGQIAPNTDYTFQSSLNLVLNREFAVAVKIEPGNGQIGSMGFTGFTGDTGAPGQQGATGFQGPQGYTGQPGLTGNQGPPGPPGISGSTGAPGATGYPGKPGNNGPPGATGSLGQIGSTGPKGARGSTGNTGDTGSTGLKGQNGSPGPRGELGAPGIPAAMSSRGETGETGFIGISGDTGSNGDTGSYIYTGDLSQYRGAPGLNGYKGFIGPPGPPGPPGPSLRLLEDGSIGTCYLPNLSGYEGYKKLRPICSGKPWPPMINLTYGEIKLYGKVEFKCIPSVLPSISIKPFRLWTRNNRPLFINSQNSMETTTLDWSSRRYFFSQDNETLTIDSLQPDDNGMWLNCVAGYGEFVLNSEASLPYPVTFD